MNEPEDVLSEACVKALDAGLAEVTMPVDVVLDLVACVSSCRRTIRIYESEVPGLLKQRDEMEEKWKSTITEFSAAQREAEQNLERAKEAEAAHHLLQTRIRFKMAFSPPDAEMDALFKARMKHLTETPEGG